MEGSEATNVQSDNDAPVDDAENQNQGGSEGLYDLNAVPEEYRPFVENIAKEIDANVTRKFQEAAEYRKSMSPYEELGVTNYEPEQMESLLQFAEIAADPDSFKEWYMNVGEEMGYLDELRGSEEEGEEDWDDDDDEELTPEEAQEMLDSLVEERLAPIMEREAQREQEQLIAEAEQNIEQQIEQLKKDYGDFDEMAVYKLSLAYAGDDDAIARGYADYADLIARTERETLTPKARGGVTPEGEGAPATGVGNPTDWATASDMARERLRASHG